MDKKEPLFTQHPDDDSKFAEAMTVLPADVEAQQRAAFRAYLINELGLSEDEADLIS